MELTILYLIIGCSSALCMVLYFLKKKNFIKKENELLAGKHVLITGGSQGIGKAIASYVVRKGASVSILARNQDLLDVASRDLQRIALHSPSQKIQTYSVDISKDYDLVENVITKAENEVGPINILVNCAGTSISRRFEDTSIEEFKRMLNINVIGTVQVTKAVLPKMKELKNGKIIIVSSIAGLFGMYGYSAYSTSKFALLGLAESLQMEVKPYNIGITVAFPPDTDTPGYKEEMKSKPMETAKISESAGLFTPEQVATQLMKDSIMGNFTSVVGVDGMLVSTVCAGMMPVSSIFNLIFEVLTMGLFRIGASLFLYSCDHVVKQCAVSREKGKKME